MRYYGKIHSKLPIFRIKSVKIYTDQKKFTRTSSVRPWQISGMGLLRAALALIKGRRNTCSLPFLGMKVYYSCLRTIKYKAWKPFYVLLVKTINKNTLNICLYLSTQPDFEHEIIFLTFLTLLRLPNQHKGRSLRWITHCRCLKLERYNLFKLFVKMISIFKKISERKGW